MVMTLAVLAQKLHGMTVTNFMVKATISIMATMRAGVMIMWANASNRQSRPGLIDEHAPSDAQSLCADATLESTIRQPAQVRHALDEVLLRNVATQPCQTERI